MNTVHTLGVTLLTIGLCGGRAAGAGCPDRYDVTWHSPSTDAGGSMPLGNGDIGLSAWIEPSGELAFYISKTDAWGDNARLLKVGRVRVGFDPPLPVTEFRQTLRLREGTMEVVCGAAEAATTVRLWVDANHPVIHMTVDGQTPCTATASLELWRTEPYELPSIEVSDVHLDRSKPDRKHAPTIVEPDTVLENLADRVGWYHHNVKSVGPAQHARTQGMTGYQRPDPLLHRTFGAVISADGGRRLDDTHLQSPRSNAHRLSIFVLTRHPSSPEQWLAAMEETIAETEKQGFDDRRAAHQQWWADFWSRSWIDVTARDAAAAVSLIPKTKYSVKIGADQSGGSRFGGQFGRVSVFDTALGDAEIAKFVQTPHEQALPRRPELLISTMPQAGQTLENSTDWTFSDGMTIEAWIKDPDGGRIVDCITPGGADGFLFDTHPRNSLRLIVGRETLLKDNALPAGQWCHVAAVVDNRTAKIKTYVNGEVVADATMTVGDDALVVSRAYALQRFVDACAGRGRYPIKFNGSIFTVPYPGRPGDADYRRWGPGYWWQNTRLPYLSMCAAGDFEMIEPLLRMYVDEILPLGCYRTRHYFGHGGAYYPECIHFWGDVFNETYGWTPFEQRQDKLQASGWHKWEWVSGPELVFMTFDLYDYTLDEALLGNRLLPAAREVLTFFDEHYTTDEGGRLVMHPAQALETWWDCTNPMPELAGLHALCARLLALPDRLTTPEQRQFWTSLQKKLAPLPTRRIGEELALAPAERFAGKRNIENPELYAVFPFRLVSFEKENANLGVQALQHRWDRGNSGWRQDDIFMAYLGLAEDARQNLVGRARKHHAGSRFPAFWGPNYDWIPDQDHGGVLMKALQAMLLQPDPYSDKIYLLPAWPKDWDVRFKLHAPYRTTVECEYRGGRIEGLKVTPAERGKDVVVAEVRN